MGHPPDVEVVHHLLHLHPALVQGHLEAVRPRAPQPVAVAHAGHAADLSADKHSQAVTGGAGDVEEGASSSDVGRSAAAMWAGVQGGVWSLKDGGCCCRWWR
jgi:hypothetical protein